MTSFPIRTLCAVVVLAAAGCVTVSDSPMQQLEVHTILGHREVAGVGCVLSNSAGRWFVVTPGRVSVERSRDPLAVDCAREGAGSAREQIASRNESRLDTDKLIGNVVVRAGLDRYIDTRAGTGYAYPATLTVIMRPPQAAAGEGQGGRQPASDDVVF